MMNSLRGAKALLDRQILNNKIETFGIAFSEFQKVYFSTNENINGYLNLVDFTGKENALSVMASGDHIFNLIVKGILNIDTFDSNRLTEYFVLGLKRALVLKCNYEEYLKSISILLNENSDKDIINDLIYSLLPYMDYKYRYYWKELIDYNYKEQKLDDTNLNFIRMLFINVVNVSELNNYLISEENYNILKSNINKCNISFKYENAINLSSEFNGNYDFILLSNILDYFYKIFGVNWNVGKLNEYIDDLSSVLDYDGVIFVNYIYNYYNQYRERNTGLISNSNINKEDLKEYIVEKIPYYNLDKLKDLGAGIILSKKR